MDVYFQRTCIGILFLALLSPAYASGNSNKESPVGIISFPQYKLRFPPLSEGDTIYLVTTKQEAFDATFTAPLGDQGAKPDFSGQMVFAISFPAGSSLKIDRAAISGNTMKIYANSCTGETADCPQNGLTLVSTPRSQSFKKIQFFINDVVRKVFSLKQ
jgi:hypothetical protein